MNERQRPTCATCRFWEQGMCHRGPPLSSIFLYGYGNVAKWVSTAPNDWCGEHQPTTEAT